MKILKGLPKEDKWNADIWDGLKKSDNSIINYSFFTEEQKRRIRETLPEAYKKKILVHKEHTLPESIQKVELETTQEDLVWKLMEWVSEKMKNRKKSRQEITKSIEFFDSTINRSFKVEIWHMNIVATGIKKYEVKFQDRGTSSIWLEESKLRNISITSQRKRKTNATRPTQPLQTIAPLRNPIGTVELSHSTFRRWVEAQVWGKKDDELGKEGYFTTWVGQDRSVWVENSKLRHISYFHQQR